MDTTPKDVIIDSRYPYRRLEPMPSAEELSEFYGSKYYDLIKEGGRAPDRRRLLQKDQESKRELDWLERGLYGDICHFLNSAVPGGRLLDIGCGSGEFVQYAIEQGFSAEGIEPSEDAARSGSEAGLAIHCATFQDFVSEFEREGAPPYDAAVLANVLEHTPKPETILESVWKIVRPGGMVCIRVPNDYSEIQLAAHRKVGGECWWISVPDHVNYFDFESLAALLVTCGFEVVHQTGDFPMEFFLLMGENYVENPELGKRCHERRIAFEKALPVELRRRLYAALAGVGIGRNILVFARKECK
jgi:2-polyprenyl-3-methyl-5-hydroxy-6-metoxy-1,4-benzoquinol methylase